MFIRGDVPLVFSLLLDVEIESICVQHHHSWWWEAVYITYAQILDLKNYTSLSVREGIVCAGRDT